MEKSNKEREHRSAAEVAVGSRRRMVWLALPFLILAVSIPIVAVLQAAGATELELMTLFEDDAYYYFRIARNLGSGLGSTFDGIHPTNGYHPLWLALLTPLFKLVADRYTALVVVKAYSGLFWIASLILLYKIARRYRAEIAFALALPIALLARDFWFNGMETTVFLMLLLAFALVWPGLVGQRRPSRSDSVLGALSLTSMLFARLDSVFFLGVVGVVLVLAPADRPILERLRSTILLLAPAGVTLAVYCAVNQAQFGSLVPVSGSAKALGADFSNWGILSRYWTMSPLASNLTRGIATGPLLVVLVIASIAAGYLASSGILRGDRSGLRRWALFVLVLATANGVQLLYYASFTTWPLWRWYHYYLPMILLFSFALILQSLFAMLPAVRRWAVLATVPIALLLCAYVARGGLWIEHAFAVNEGYKTFSVLMANRLNESTPADAILAMGDRAGSLGYLLDRPLVQLEGLVNSVEYLHHLETGKASEFLRAEGVTYLLYSGPWVAAEEDFASLPCKIINQPLHGDGPKEHFELCLDEAQFVRPLLIRTGHREIYGVWDFDAVNIAALPVNLASTRRKTP